MQPTPHIKAACGEEGTFMKKFEMLVPAAHGKPDRDIVEEFVALIPFGEEEAIDRKLLTQMCVNAGFIETDAKDPDRIMRRLMQKAKIDYAICNIGNGYFRPLPKDVHSLKICIAKERSRALSIFGSISTLEKLYEDIVAGRIKERCD